MKVNHRQKTRPGCYENSCIFIQQSISDKMILPGKYWWSPLTLTQLNRGHPCDPSPVAARQVEPVRLFSALFPIIQHL